jgi:hypothetical protein
MTRGTGSLPGKQSLTARGIADLDGGATDIKSGANERDKRRHFGRLQLETRHPGVRYAIRDDAPNVIVGDGSPKSTAPKIDARHQIAIGTMAQGAFSRVQLQPRLNIAAGILVVLLSC